MKLVALSLLFLGVAADGQPDTAASTIFGQIRAHVIAQLKKASNYICVQTTERTTYIPEELVAEGCQHLGKHPDRKQEEMHDRLRLDVAVSGGNEIYEWHGSNQFTSESIDQIVQNGAVSSGGFNGFLLNIFTTAGVEITALKSPDAEHNLFSYYVPLHRSTYQTRGTGGLLPVSYRGFFNAKASTSELESLTVTAEQLPEGSNVCAVSNTITYQIVKIGKKDVLIPKDSELHMAGDSHEETISHTAYSDCHEYSGESTLKLDYADENAPGATSVPVKDVTLPPNLRFRVQLQQTLDSEKNYTGDPIQAVLASPLKLPKGQGVIPAGSPAIGVITQMARYKLPSPFFLLGLRFNRIVAGDTIYELAVTEDVTLDQQGTLTFLYGRSVPSFVLASFHKTGQGTFITATRHLHMDRGHSFSLITRERKQEKQSPE